MQTASTTTSSPASREQFLRTLNTSWKMALYMLRHLPTLRFWGVKIRSVTEAEASVTLPYGWRTQNPFRSIYFAAQCGAAEISTGLLAMAQLHGRGKVSMLITRVEAQFLKKANSLTTFTCADGAIIREAIERAVATKEGQEVTVVSTGVQANGEIVAKVHFTWSFKVKA
jgi:acyl-coenzyme A thioesterase PaaI-like protein